MRILLHWGFQTIFNVTQKSIFTHLNSIQYPSDMGELVTNGVRNGCIRKEKQREGKLNRRRKCWFRYSELIWIICAEKFLISWSELNKISHFYFYMSVNSDYTQTARKLSIMEISVANYNRHEPKIKLKLRISICIYKDSRRSTKLIFLCNFKYLFTVFWEYIKKHHITSF